ncbi:TetR/AcrR family transcriptional regulator [Neptunomonas japonica]|uniref:TetR family transcriptional regulator n=1 Tax=Neptunomonas japonica JAMM 1380 TaxID=1441457 RepID=A0A7R6PU61_9GAMM|nr:TetR/AcrR family transcriptional regulator [Neptunomonas japonica]BBB30530.1 TetR family transcriptional regulator [Neptunomonas japonica JAMM 1380]
MARPAEFDRSEVLNKAMEVFWRTGYNATSVTDLVHATSLKPGSLYGAFNSKRGLFLEVIDNYANRSLTRISECMEQSDSAIDAIAHFFSRICKEIECDEIGRGCLMVNTLLELATEDDDIRIKITEYLNRIEHYFYLSLENARLQGEIKSDTDCDSLAKMLMTGIWGLRVMSTTRPDPVIYTGIIGHLLASLERAKY